MKHTIVPYRVVCLLKVNETRIYLLALLAHHKLPEQSSILHVNHHFQSFIAETKSQQIPLVKSVQSALSDLLTT